MKLNKIADWLQIIANFGILIGLILVLMQMRQNEELQRIQIMNQYHDSYSAYETAFAGENLPDIWEKSWLEPENLTLSEMRAMEAITFVPLNRWINLYRQSEAGILDQEDWKYEVLNDVSYYFDTPYARAWWQEMGSSMHDVGYIPSEMYDIIEERLNDSKARSQRDAYESMLKTIRENGQEADAVSSP